MFEGASNVKGARKPPLGLRVSEEVSSSGTLSQGNGLSGARVPHLQDAVWEIGPRCPAVTAAK